MDFAGYMLLLLWNRYTLTFPRELSAVYSGKPSRLFAATRFIVIASFRVEIF